MSLDQELQRAWKELRPYATGELPRWIKVAQDLPGECIDDVEMKISQQLNHEDVRRRLRPGMKVAVGVGSRGVANIARVVRVVVDTLKRWEVQPFIVPAMGSHGASSAEGQKSYLARLGVSEDTMGAPVRATMDVDEVGQLSNGLPAYFDRIACQADAVIPINRIKPHTSIRSEVESGLHKMLAIGFGKQKGATTWHIEPPSAMGELISEAGEFLIERMNVPFGIALVENAQDETAIAEVIPGEMIPIREPELLVRAKELMGRILVNEFDILVIDRIGKNVSGVGADPNVTGRYSLPYLEGGVQAQKLVGLDLTPETHGSAVGMGLFDVVTKRLIEKVDLVATWVNVITARTFAAGRIPLIMENDREAIGLAANTLYRTKSSQSRVVRVHDTMHLHEIWISEPLWKDHKNDGIFEALSDVHPIPFDTDGNLSDAS